MLLYNLRMGGLRMTYKEQAKMLAEKLKEFEDKYRIRVSPRIIQRTGSLIHNYNGVALYEAREENTDNFVREQVTDLITKAYRNNGEAENTITLELVYKDGWDDFPETIFPFEDFIMKYKDKLIAVYKYVESTEERSYFVGFTHTETINKYGYMYLDLAKLLELLKENDITWSLDTTKDLYGSYAYRDDSDIKFKLSYGKKKDLDGEDTPSLKRK